MKTQIILISLFSLLYNSLFSQTGRIIDVIDGDTVTIKINEYSSRKTFDIAYIDAPEIKQEFGMKSKQYLVNLLMHKQVSFTVVGNSNWKKNFARKNNPKIVLFFGNGEDLGKHLINNGYAWFNKRSNISLERKKEFIKLEKKAKRKNLGLWDGENIQYPLDFAFVERKKKERSVISSQKNRSYSGVDN